jgi:hypothetical protein
MSFIPRSTSSHFPSPTNCGNPPDREIDREFLQNIAAICRGGDDLVAAFVSDIGSEFLIRTAVETRLRQYVEMARTRCRKKSRSAARLARRARYAKQIHRLGEGAVYHTLDTIARRYDLEDQVDFIGDRIASADPKLVALLGSR